MVFVDGYARTEAGRGWLGGLPHTALAVRLAAALVLAALLLLPNDISIDTLQPASRSESLAQPTHPAGLSEVDLAEKSHEKTNHFQLGVKSKTRRLEVYRRSTPASRARSIVARNPIDQRLIMLVRKSRTRAGQRWFEILLPERPNGSTGWVRRADVVIVRLRQAIHVDLSERRLTYFRRGHLVGRYTVGVGTPSTPTPTGTFYVWARVPQTSPQGAYGVYALGLSGFSVLSDWPGGGRAAIHGTPNPTDAGRAVSHGCIRVPNEDMRNLMGLPMGTPVTIRA
jgi:lipoprotein-anchoring transpeptidase ErfK/SrfK